MNKCIKFLIVGLVVAGATLASYAANITVNWGANDLTGVLLADGTPVPVGSPVMIGMFDVTPTDGSPDLTFFHAFAQGAMGDGKGLGGFWYDTTTKDETFFPHRQAYIVVQNAAATQLGIFAFNMVDAINWKFPAATDIPPSTTLDLQDMVNDPGTPGATLKSGAHIFYGSGPPFGTGFTTLGLAPGDGQTFFQLAEIPEPTNIILVGLGLLGIVAMRRRSS